MRSIVIAMHHGPLNRGKKNTANTVQPATHAVMKFETITLKITSLTDTHFNDEEEQKRPGKSSSQLHLQASKPQTLSPSSYNFQCLA